MTVRAFVASLVLVTGEAMSAEFVTSPWDKKFVDEIPAAEMAKGLTVKGTHDRDHGIFGGELVLRGTNNVAPAFVKIENNTRLTLRHRLSGGPLEIDVPYGAVLDCSAIHGGQAVRRIKFDCHDGAGSLLNVRLVGKGTIELTNFDVVRSTGMIPLDLTACVDGENILKWNFIVDGKAMDMEARIRHDRGVLIWEGEKQSKRELAKEWVNLPMWGGGYMQDVVFTSDPKILYSYADVSGPYRSEDGGLSWQHLGANFTMGMRAQTMGQCRTLSPDPRNPDSIVMMAGGEARHNVGGFMVSRNGGKSWRKTGWMATSGGDHTRMYGRVLSRDPFNPDVLVGGEDWWGICVSFNNGETWTRTGPTQQWFTCVQFDKVRQNRIYACGRRFDNIGYYSPGHDKPRSGGFWISEDGGRKWQKAADEAPWEIDQINGSGEVIGIFGDRQIRRSNDGCKTWHDFSEGLPGLTEKQNSGKAEVPRIIAMGSGSDFYLVGDIGGTICRRGIKDGKWQEMPRYVLKCSYPDEEPCARHRVNNHKIHERIMDNLCTIVVDPRDDNHWLTTDWFEIWESRDAGKTFTTRQRGISQLCSATFECDPLSPDYLAYGVHDMGYYMSYDGGKTFGSPKSHFWLWPYDGFGHAVVYSVAFSPIESGLMFAASYCLYGGVGILRSRDHGQNWEFPKCAGMPKRVRGTNGVNTIVFRPDRNEIWACEGGVLTKNNGGPYFSTDYGETWTWAGHGMAEEKNYYKIELNAGGPTQQIAFSKDGSGVTLAKDSPNVYAWKDKEKSWVKVKLPRGARGWKPYSLVADPHTPGRFMIGGENLISESNDGGLTWHPLEGYKGECSQLAFDWNTRGLLVLACPDAIRISRDGGKSFELLPGGYQFDSCGVTARASNYSFNVPAQLTVDRKRIFYVSSQNGVFRRIIK